MVRQQPLFRQQGAQQQIQKHQSLSLSKVAFRVCKLNPLKVSREEMMREKRRHTHSLTCACTHPPHALTYAHIRARIPVCTDTHTQRYMHAHKHTHTYKYAHTHARKCIRTCTHAPTHAYNHKQASAHACSRTRTRIHTCACTNSSTCANAHAPARTTHMHARHT